MKVLIVGGVAGGATAAARLRRLDENAEIIMFERTGYVSYANCGLPYYIGGVIPEKRSLTLQTPESFKKRFNIDVRIKSEVTDIDTENKTVTVCDLSSGNVYTERYDKLLLAPGAKASLPPIEGVDSPRAFTLRTVEDTFAIYDYLADTQAKKAVVIGGGFIGIETAENLMHRGLSVTLLTHGNQVMPPFDYDMACQLHAYMRSRGIDLRLNRHTTALSEYDSGIKVHTDEDGEINADLVIIATGVTPDSALAVKAGLKTGIKGSILVDSRMRTSAKDVYAVGDAVQVVNFVSGTDALIPLAGPANKQARIAADNIAGGNSEYKGSQGSSVIKIFGLTAATTGLNEKSAKAVGIGYEKTVTFSASHATYYPGATDMTVKLIFSKTDGKVLGAQIIGFDGTDKRIDVIATAIRAGMTVYDLTELDLAYAPPYSSAKDPVNMAGYVATNVLGGKVKQFHWNEVGELCKRGDVIMLDVRTPREFAQGHFPNAVNIPVDALRGRINELDADKPIYVNCYSGLRSYIACRMLSAHGFDCYNFSGGFGFYSYIAYDKKFDETCRGDCGLPIVN